MELLNTFTLREFEKLNHFIHVAPIESTAFEKDVIRLFEWIYACSPDFQHEALIKENVFAGIFPDKSFVPNRLEKVMSGLLKQVRNFIIHEYSGLESDEVLQLLALSKFYRAKRLKKRFHQNTDAIQKLLEKDSLQERERFYQSYKYHEELFFYENENNQRKGDLHVPELLVHFDRFYLIARLEYLIILIQQANLSNILTVDYEQLLYNTLDMLDQQPFKDEAVFRIYRLAIRITFLQTTQEDEAFEELNELLPQNEELFSEEQIMMLYGLLRSYCARCYNKGRKEFLGKVFDMYRTHIERGFMYSEGGILGLQFNNIVQVGLRNKQYDWVHKFLLKYQYDIVATDYPKEVFDLNLANYYFEVGRFEEALNLLSFTFESPEHKIHARRQELKIYYELKNPLLDDKVDAFKVLLYDWSKKKVISPINFEAYNNFTDLLRQIMRTPKSDMGRIERLFEKMQEKRLIAERDWLFEKLESLK